MFFNVVVGKPLVDPKELIALDQDDWEKNEKPYTLFTDTRYLPAILKEAGIAPSISQVRKNKPIYDVMLENPDCITVKWGKKFLFIVVGE